MGLGVIPNKRRKTDEKNYERIVNRHNLKTRFCKSVYTLALLAKNVIALKYQAHQQIAAVAYLLLAKHFLAISLAQQSINLEPNNTKIRQKQSVISQLSDFDFVF